MKNPLFTGLTNGYNLLMAYDIGALSSEWFEQVWNLRNDTAIARLASPDVVSQGLGEDGKPVRGFDQFKQFRKSLLSAFPDMHVHVKDVLVDGNKTAVRLTLSGTHTGDGIGIAPTGRRLDATAIVILRFQEGVIVEAWNEFDAAGMMRQLQAPTATLRA